MAELTIRGLDQVVRRLQELAQRDGEAFKAALYQEGEIEMTESKRRVPVDTGALRESGRAESVENGAGVRLVYGDAAVDYAWIVHEDLDAYHDDGTAKYLERPVLESLPHLADRVATRMQRIRGGS